MSILVTGGSGWLGEELCKVLLERGLGQVHTVSRAGRASPGVSSFTHSHTADVSNADELENVFRKICPLWVFHLAADTRRSRDQSMLADMMQANFQGAKNIAEVAQRHGVKALVFATTFEEYGPIDVPFAETDTEKPVSPYGISKLQATRYMMQLSNNNYLPVTVLRFPLLFSNRPRVDTFLGALRGAIESGIPVRIPSMRITRDFLHLSDAVDALIVCAQNIAHCRGEIVNICSGKEMSLQDVVKLAEKLSEISPLALMSDQGLRENELVVYVGCPEKARRLVGWSCKITFEEGLAALVQDALKEKKITEINTNV